MATNTPAVDSPDGPSSATDEGVDSVETADSGAIPCVIKFAYKEFALTLGGTWTAKCRTCGTLIKEKRGVTSGFTK
jgi:hypothetical protein